MTISGEERGVKPPKAAISCAPSQTPLVAHGDNLTRPAEGLVRIQRVLVVVLLKLLSLLTEFGMERWRGLQLTSTP
jgi:hypothetical protein